MKPVYSFMARKFGLAEAQLKRKIQQLRQQGRIPASRERRWTDEEHAKFAELYAKNPNAAYIAQQMGLPTTCVQHHIYTQKRR